MTRQRTIARLQLMEASNVYWDLVHKLPPFLQEACPAFKEYLAPDQYPYLHTVDWVTLSVKGTQRYEALLSPHALTLLAIYAIQRLEAS